MSTLSRTDFEIWLWSHLHAHVLGTKEEVLDMLGIDYPLTDAEEEALMAAAYSVRDDTARHVLNAAGRQ